MKTSAPARTSLLVLTVLFLFGCTQEARRERQLRNAAAHFAAGDFERARIEYQNVLQSDPNNVAALKHLGLLWLERGAPVRALPYLLQVRALSPDDREIHLKTLQIALGSGKLSEARKGALALLARSPGNSDALILLSETTRGPEEQNELRDALRGFPNRNLAAFHLASANLALQTGNFPLAKASLQRAVALEPKSPTVHSALAACHLVQNNAIEAAKSLEAAVAVAPLRSKARLQLAEFKAARGAAAEAITSLRTLTAQAPDYFPAWHLLAQIAVNERKPDEAQRHLQAIFDRDPANYEARLLEVQLALAQSDSAKALAKIATLEAEFPGFAEPKYLLAQAHLQKRDVPSAITALRKAIIQNPDHEPALLLLATLQLRAGEAEPVVLAMADLLTKRPALERAQLLLIDALGALGRLDDVARIARLSIETSAENPRAHFLLGLVLARQDRIPEARQSLEKALELMPDAAPVVGELIRLDLKARDIPAARQRVQTLVSKTPNHAIAHLLDAHVHVAERHWEAAETAIYRALALSPDNPSALDLLAGCYVAQNKSPQTFQRLEAFVSNRAHDPRALALAGTVYLQSNQPEKARDAYEKHLATTPDTIAVLNNLAYLYSDHLGNLDRALELARRARELEPHSPEVADTLGWILFKRQDYPRAVELLKESAAKRPDNAEIQLHLRLATEKLAAQP